MNTRDHSCRNLAWIDTKEKTEEKQLTTPKDCTHTPRRGDYISEPI